MHLAYSFAGSLLLSFFSTAAPATATSALVKVAVCRDVACNVSAVARAANLATAAGQTAPAEPPAQAATPAPGNQAGQTTLPDSSSSNGAAQEQQKTQPDSSPAPSPLGPTKK